MAFTLPTRPEREVISKITVQLEDPDGTNANRTITAQVIVHNLEGEWAGTWQGDLQPHLGAGTLSSLATFLDNLRTQAEQELLNG